MISEHKKTVSLVLGSGGARGLAHIGVIQWLEENGYEIKSVAGSSIGALVGGIYASGKLDKLEEWMRGITKLNLFTLMDFSWQMSGLVKGDKLIKALVNLVGDQLVEELPIPFTAVAADIKREKEIWINKGSLFDAIRASISIPLLFTPFRINGIDLVDGGVLNPVPIAPTFGDATDITIAVNLGGPAETPEKLADYGVTPPVQNTSFVSKFNFFNSQKSTAAHSEELGVYDVFLQSFDAMQNTIARQKLAAYPPSIDIEIPRNACDMLDFDHAASMISLGYNKAKEAFADQELE